MIIDCDTHFVPKDAFDYVEGHLSSLRPSLKFDDKGALVDIDFPGKPPMVQGTTPTPAPGSGAHYAGIVDIEERLNDYEKMGIDADLFTPIFAMARVAGWLAHWLEQLRENKLFRPDQIYAGEHDRPYVPLDQR